MDIYWEIMNSDLLEVMLVSRTSGYAAIGWCDAGSAYSPSRDNVSRRCSYWAGGVSDTSGVAFCADLHDRLRGSATKHWTESPYRDDADGGENDVLDCAAQISGGRTFVKFLRKLDTGDSATFDTDGNAGSQRRPFDTTIVNADQYMIWATGPNGISCSVWATSPGVRCNNALHVDWGWERLNMFADNIVDSSPMPMLMPRSTAAGFAATSAPTNGGALASGVLAYWSFNDGATIDIIASVPLVLRNGAQIDGELAKRGSGALRIENNGFNTIDVVSAQSALALPNEAFRIRGHALSHVVWFRTLHGGSNGAKSGIIVWTRNGFLRSDGNALHFELFPTQFAQRGVLDGTFDVQPRTWYHVAAVYGDRTMRLFVDCETSTCEPIASTQLSSDPPLDPSFSDANCGVVFGVHCELQDSLSAQIDDYALFDIELKRADIAVLMAGVASIFTAAPPPTTTAVEQPPTTERLSTNVSDAAYLELLSLLTTGARAWRNARRQRRLSRH